MSKRWLAPLLGCLALAPVAAGCGGGGGDNNGGSGSGNNSAPAPAATGGGGSVTMKDIQFNPSSVTVKAGDTVTWTNDDSVGHDVTGDGFKSGSAGGIQGGQSFKHKFATAGTFKYVCTIHPGMKGTVVVK